MIPLLDSIDEKKAESSAYSRLSSCIRALQSTFSTVLSAAYAFQTRFSTAPTVDLKGKKKEINTLFDGLQKDSKISIKERSNRQELLEELFDSLTSWLNDIWSLVYEHHFGYAHAHTCLLFVADVVAKLHGIPGG